MADSNYFDVLSSSDQIRDNYEKFKDKYTDSSTNGIDSETFLKLLVAEMSNQDPLEPTSNTEFISQLAQFSSMQYMQDSSKYAQANYAASLVGKTVTVSKVEGKEVIIITGEVEKVTKNKDNTYTVTVNGEEFSLDKISSVSAVTKKDDSDDKTDSTDKVDNVLDMDVLGDRIARASAMIGLYATIGIGEVSEGTFKEVQQGFIESIQVNSGKINVIINGKPQPIENILEVTVAYVVDDPENPDDPDDTEGSQGVGGSESVEGGDNQGTDNADVSDVTDPGDAAGSAEADGFIRGGEDIPDIPDVSDMPEDEAIAQIMDIIQAMGG